jgi:pimeloyl-ACP methyl ester carboxylesterase
MNEKPILFGRAKSLAGVLTVPAGATSSVAVVILGAGILHRIGPSRISVRLARSLADAGYHSLRFDLSGVGDSALDLGATNLDASVDADIQDAITLILEETGCEGVILLGYCSGANQAYGMAGQDKRIRGVVLYDPGVQRTRGFRMRKNLQRLKSPRAWFNLLSGYSLYIRIKERFETPPPEVEEEEHEPFPPQEEMEDMARAGLDNGVRYIYIISGGIAFYCNSPKQVQEGIPGAFDPERMTVVGRPEMDHIMTRQVDQQWLIQTVLDWLGEHWAPPAEEADS